jgi:hypothetical protein
MTTPTPRPPLWFTLIIILLLLPLLMWPAYFSDTIATPEGRENSVYAIIFPIYALLSAWLAYKTFTSRRELSFIILALLIISYLAVIIL